MRYYRLGFLVGIMLFLSSVSRADETAQADLKEAADSKDKAELYAKFSAAMSGVQLVGNFTIIGEDNSNLREEAYTILSAKKLSEGDKWLLHARIKYGQADLTVPLKLDVVWAGDTPVITLTKFTIPGLGTFSSRVVVYNGKYAGTWTHDQVGGHLFGVVKAIEPPAKVDDEKDSKDES